MAQVAYDLNYFAPTPRRARPQVRVAKRTVSARKVQMLRMVRTLFGVLVLVGLVCAVLYTQTRVTELQSDIATKKQELVEEEALYAYLSFEMDNKTSLKNIEETAAGMGLQRVDSSQITYFRVEEGEAIRVKENPFSRLFQNTKSGLLNIVDYIRP